MRLLLDEHLSPRVARLLRERGHDVVAVAERPGLVGLEDQQIWSIAISEDRAVVTVDVRDYSVLARLTAAAGHSHPGLVLVASSAFPPRRDGIGRMADALDRLATTNRAGLGDRVTWLEPDGD